MVKERMCKMLEEETNLKMVSVIHSPAISILCCHLFRYTQRLTDV